MYGQAKDIMSRDAVFTALKKRGVAKVEVHYSGGNDEGGVNDIIFLDANGENIGRMDEYYGGTQEWDDVAKKYLPAKPPTDDQRLSMSLCVPVYDKYYSFAGEFYVNGTLTWDVTTGKVNMRGTEEVSHDEDFDDEL